MNKKTLTRREKEVMDILWNHDNPLPACEIQKELPELAVNSILPILKRLLDKNYIYVEDYSQHNKALMREFRPTISKERYMASLMDDKTLLQLTTSFIQECNDMNVLNLLQREIDKKKEGK